MTLTAATSAPSVERMSETPAMTRMVRQITQRARPLNGRSVAIAANQAEFEWEKKRLEGYGLTPFDDHFDVEWIPDPLTPAQREYMRTAPIGEFRFMDMPD